MPRGRGSALNASRIRSWIQRFEGYRVGITEARIRTWLQTFKSADIDLGARILDAVTFLKAEEMERALREMVGRLPGWHKHSSRRRGRWRFVAFSISAGESGDSMLHKARTALGLTGAQYNDIFIHKADLLRENLGSIDNVVFFDDFSGTGQQACRAWRGDTETKITGLTELLPGNPRAYLILIAASDRARNRIRQETSLIVSARYILGSNDDIFSAQCTYFTSAEKEQLLTYCRRADSKNPRGFGDCGFVIVLAHRTPNNSIPILHANHDRWRGLFPRH